MKEEINQKEENFINFDKENNPVIKFDKLNAKYKFDDPKKPVFFVPLDKHLDTNNVIQTSFEPFDEVVYREADMYIKAVGNDSSIDTMRICIMSQASSIIMSNINIIFECGILEELKKFSYSEKYNFVIQEYIETLNMNTILKHIESLIYDSFSDIYNYNTQRAMVDLFCKFNVFISNELASNMYKFINNILIKEYINLNTLAIYAYKQSNHNIISSEDDADLLDSSKFSIAMQYLLNGLCFDLNRILEISELSIVNAYYRLVDLTFVSNKICENTIEDKYD